MIVDWDGKIRMDRSRAIAMQGLIALKDRFTSLWLRHRYDRPRHRERSSALAHNHYLRWRFDSICSRHRPGWAPPAASQDRRQQPDDDRVAAKQPPFVEVRSVHSRSSTGLLDGSLALAGRRVPGRHSLRRDGSAWSTTRMAYLGAAGAEITATRGATRASSTQQEAQFGDVSRSVWMRRRPRHQKSLLGKLSPQQVKSKQLAGER